MHRLITFALMAGLTIGGKTEELAKTSMAESPGVPGVKVVTDEAKHRVDVTINGEPFTSYLWATNQRKPVLYPIIAPDGTTVTRGYPFETRPGERVDHPHHAGLWFNYGNANNFDFWNNSDAIKPADRPKYGTIRHDRIVSTKSGSTSGELTAESTWTTGANQDIFKQTTRYIFSNTTIGGKPARSIDMIVTLKALDKVVFHDDKEGVLGMRVAHFLESATEKGGIFLDASGNPTKVDAADTAGATGVYLTSEGKTGDAAWATRGRWCTLTGSTNNHTETIAILDNPTNPGFPTYWHARGYGLFAANPLGRSIFDPKQPAFNYTLEKDQSATFRYRILFLSNATTADEMNHLADAFAKAH
jgi:Methane oxygenase PmoA